MEIDSILFIHLLFELKSNVPVLVSYHVETLQPADLAQHLCSVCPIHFDAFVSPEKEIDKKTFNDFK